MRKAPTRCRERKLPTLRAINLPYIPMVKCTTPLFGLFSVIINYVYYT